jgi:hypothetical protein
MSPYYNCYELTNNTSTNDWTDLVNLTYQIYNPTDAQFNSSVSAVLNTQSFIGAWAAYNLFCDFDSYPYRYTHNYYTYHNSATDKFEWIIWDVSTAFGLDIPGTISSIENQSVLYVTPDVNYRPLVKRMLENAAFRNTYLQTICSYASNDFLPSVLNPKIDALHTRIQADVYADNLKMYSNVNFEDNINGDTTINGYDVIGLKSFIANRSTAVTAELNALGYSNCPLPLATAGTLATSAISIYPNPAGNYFAINSTTSQAGLQLSIYDLQGKTFHRQALTAENNNRIQIDGLAAGMYFIKLENTNEVKYFKLIKK